MSLIIERRTNLGLSSLLSVLSTIFMVVCSIDIRTLEGDIESKPWAFSMIFLSTMIFTLCIFNTSYHTFLNWECYRITVHPEI